MNGLEPSEVLFDLKQHLNWSCVSFLIDLKHHLLIHCDLGQKIVVSLWTILLCGRTQVVMRSARVAHELLYPSRVDSGQSVAPRTAEREDRMCVGRTERAWTL